MAGPASAGTFPFGRPLLRRRASAKSKRRVFVLGMLPGALHIAWWSPTRKLVKALAVDNEPTSFWTGADEKEQIAAWKRVVGFRLGEWGEVETSDVVNGAAGRWLDEQVLAPLGVTREEACLSTCVDTYLASAAQVFAVTERYQPWAREAGLPEASSPPQPREDLVELAVAAHGERILHELSVTVPELVVTLGNGALRVVRTITEAKRGPGRLRPDASYGVEHTLDLGKRSAIWLALAQPCPPNEWAQAHALWREGRP
jgi:hypothetical protein